MRRCQIKEDAYLLVESFFLKESRNRLPTLIECVKKFENKELPDEEKNKNQELMASIIIEQIKLVSDKFKIELNLSDDDIATFLKVVVYNSLPIQNRLKAFKVRSESNEILKEQ